MASDSHLEMMALSRVTLASAGLSCLYMDMMVMFTMATKAAGIVVSL